MVGVACAPLLGDAVMPPRGESLRHVRYQHYGLRLLTPTLPPRGGGVSLSPISMAAGRMGSLLLVRAPPPRGRVRA